MARHYSTSQLRILLIEPSGVQASVITSYLQKLGATHIDHVGTAQQAMNSLKKAEYELVLSAMYLADMSGVELLTLIRSLPETQNQAFILVSSETRPQMLEPVRQLGICAIVPKPFTEAQLAQALNTTLDYLSDDMTFDGEILLDSLRVLLVDDSRAARNFMRQVLGNLGVLLISEASNGREAMNQLEANSFDLVLTDYNMPEMDGRQLVEYIRNSSWQSDLPILMVSSETNAGRLAAVEQAGVSGICDKPFEPAIIRALIGKVLQQKQHD